MGTPSKPVAVRRFDWADGNGHVEARIYAPRERGGDFYCRVELSGIGRAPQKHDVMGADSLQALRLAIGSVRYFLQPIASELRWLEGSPWLDLPREVPVIFGDGRDGRFQRAIDAEMDRLSHENGENPVALRRKQNADELRRRKQLLALRKKSGPMKRPRVKPLGTK
jgi:hypothetical protein